MFRRRHELDFRRHELDFRDKQPLDERESDSDDAEIFFSPYSFSLQLRSPSLITPFLMEVVVFFWVIFCGEIRMIKDCCGFGCEIGMGMVVCGGMFMGLLIRFGRRW